MENTGLFMSRFALEKSGNATSRKVILGEVRAGIKVRTGLVALAGLLAAGIFLSPARGYAGRAGGGNATVLTNSPSASEVQDEWAKAAFDSAIASMPGGPRSRSAIRRYNPNLIKDAKIKMQMEANSEPARPTLKKGAVASGPAAPGLTPAIHAPGAPPATGELLSYSQLPVQIRESIPIAMTMLVYSKIAEKRSITVNSWKLAEGQEVSPGLKVEEITSDGALFSYQGYRFHKKVVGD